MCIRDRDKVIMKKVFESCNLPIVDYTWFYRSAYEENKVKYIEKAEKIGYPLIVKPANLGSSVGINKAKNLDELLFAIDVAKAYDRKIIVEKCLEDVREINCAVIGYENNLQTSLCEEPVGWKDFLTYEDKYVNKKKDSSESKRRIPADIDEETETKIKDYATEVLDVYKRQGRYYACKSYIRYWDVAQGHSNRISDQYRWLVRGYGHDDR